PASARWTHATDRFAAALCLFQLYAGRHAFDGRVPEPNEGPQVSEADIDPPGLAAFFLKALAPEPARRFPSARAMREALRAALGPVGRSAGRHAVDGGGPEPNEGRQVSEADIDPPGLAACFLKARAPGPARRFPPARAMREALRVALGEDATTPASVPPAAQI